MSEGAAMQCSVFLTSDELYAAAAALGAYNASLGPIAVKDQRRFGVGKDLCDRMMALRIVILKSGDRYPAERYELTLESLRDYELLITALSQPSRQPDVVQPLLAVVKEVELSARIMELDNASS